MTAGPHTHKPITQRVHVRPAIFSRGEMPTQRSRIGFVSSRLAGTDGVSLETVKWSQVLSKLGHECFYFAGESDWPDERSMMVPEAHFTHPDIQKITVDLFDDYVRTSETSKNIQDMTDYLKAKIYRFINRFHLQLLIVENVLSLPMNIPLGMALTQVIAETHLPTIAHHHDFVWERRRYSISAADDYIRAAFPPTLNAITHVVINSFAGRQLALRTGVGSSLIPNVMGFEESQRIPDEYADDLRSEIGVKDSEYLLLQPTRVIPRKRIEYAIELSRRLDLPSVLVISHASGDESPEYEAHLREYAHLMGARTVFAAERIAFGRGAGADGKKIYALGDAYQQANLVTYPSAVEGFGNAFLEAVFYRRPVVMSAYEIFKVDIEPKGFRVISFQDFVDATTVRLARKVLTEPDVAAEMVEHNFRVGLRYYSYTVLEQRLSALIDVCLEDY